MGASDDWPHLAIERDFAVQQSRCGGGLHIH
jgi:hypothetical protein